MLSGKIVAMLHENQQKPYYHWLRKKIWKGEGNSNKDTKKKNCDSFWDKAWKSMAAIVSRQKPGTGRPVLFPFLYSIGWWGKWVWDRAKKKFVATNGFPDTLSLRDNTLTENLATMNWGEMGLRYYIYSVSGDPMELLDHGHGPCDRKIVGWALRRRIWTASRTP